MKRIFLPTLIIASLYLTGCAELFSDSLDTLDSRNFVFFLDVLNPEDDYDKGDTIWIEQTIPDEAIDGTFNKQEAIENATVNMNVSLSLLYTEADSIPFINSNFDVVVEHGTLEIANVFDYDEAVAYQFQVLYGLPSPEKTVKIGIIPYYEGTFVIEASGSIFYGPDRSDAQDYSINNNLLGELTYLFSGSDFNKELYFDIPIEERTAFGGFFNTVSIDNGLYYFIEID